MYVGLDIGYGQTKLTFTDLYTPTIGEVHPSGSAPVVECNRNAATSAGSQNPGVDVLVHGNVYGSLIDPDHLARGMNVLHKGFVSTKEYLALYYGALSRMRGNVVEHLVTGLPVEQYKDDELVAELKRLLIGSHRIQQNRTIEVKKVSVIPQAMGAYLHHLDKQPLGYGEDESILVIDFGHYSIDWIVVGSGNFKDHISGSIPHGGSVVIEKICALIKDADKNNDIAPELVYRYVRTKKTSVKLGRHILDMDDLKDRAAASVGPGAINMILSKLRLERTAIHKVLLCGGSAPFFKKYVQDAFEQAEVEDMDHAVLANAFGYGLVAQRDV